MHVMLSNVKSQRFKAWMKEWEERRHQRDPSWTAKEWLFAA